MIPMPPIGRRRGWIDGHIRFDRAGYQKNGRNCGHTIESLERKPESGKGRHMRNRCVRWRKSLAVFVCGIHLGWVGGRNPIRTMRDWAGMVNATLSGAAPRLMEPALGQKATRRHIDPNVAVPICPHRISSIVHRHPHSLAQIRRIGRGTVAGTAPVESHNRVS